MAAVIDRTDDEKTLQLNCLKTDFFHGEVYPAYLFCNPYREAREIRVDVGAATANLYDVTRHQFLSRRASGRRALHLAPDSAALIVLVPTGGVVTRDGSKLLANGIIVDYCAPEFDGDGNWCPDRVFPGLQRH